MKLDQVNELLFKNGGSAFPASYFLTRDAVNNQSVDYGYVWLVIDFENGRLKIAKPQTILLQPKEIIEKIVEREIRIYKELAY